MSEILTARGIHKTYRNGKKSLEVIKGIDLSVEKGAAVFIVGPWGAGKSTLMHILGGLDRADKGSVLIDGMNISTLSDRRRALLRTGRIGFVFQFYHLLPEFTALENVMMPARMDRSIGLAKARERAQRLLVRLGLSGRQENKPHQLSGGERQRVAIARAMVNSPSILFCDEPTGNLDSANGDEIYKLLYEVRKEEGLTLVIVMHQMDYTKNADFILNMKDGLLL